MKIYTGAFALFTLVLLLGCSSNGSLTHEQSCQQRYDELEKKFVKQKYAVIREKLNDLITTCTGSGFIEEAQYMLAESHFNLKEWLEAEHEYKIFLEDFPTSKHIENAHFRMAVSKKNQTLSIGRDQSTTREAITEFESFTKNFPQSKLLDSAQQFRRELRFKLAQKDINTGNLYLKLKEPQAAVLYFKSVKENYPEVIDTGELSIKMIQSYIDLGQLNQAESLIKEVKTSVQSPHANQLEKLKLALLKKRQEYNEARQNKGQKPKVDL